jgi:hypothetical protein
MADADTNPPRTIRGPKPPVRGNFVRYKDFADAVKKFGEDNPGDGRAQKMKLQVMEKEEHNRQKRAADRRAHKIQRRKIKDAAIEKAYKQDQEDLPNTMAKINAIEAQRYSRKER